MSKTILMDVDGFTPLIDAVVLDVGLVTAAVFGKAWRFCQMPEGICRAAQHRIAKELGLSRATVNTHFSKLVDSGYLIDTTPDLLGLPHTYADTGKANLSISLTGGVKNVDKGYQKDLQEGVKNVDTKIVKETKKKQKRIDESATPKATEIPELALHRSVVKHWCKPFQRQTVIDAVREINARLGRDATIDDLQPFFTAWAKVSGNDWSIVWLVDWAVSGQIPNGKKTTSTPQPPPAQGDNFMADLAMRRARLQAEVSA